METNVPDRVVAVLEERQRFLLALHVSPDGDSVGSSLGLALALQARGKTGVVAAESSVPQLYQFLPAAEDVRGPEEIEGEEFDAALLIDCGDLHRTGTVEPVLKKIPLLINIDHHATNSGYGDIAWIDPDSASAGEMVYRLLRKLGWPLDARVATCLYTAISTDTGSFRYQGTTAATMRAAADLIAAGADPFLVGDAVYEHKSLASQRLLGYVLENMSFGAGGRLAFACLPWSVYEQAGAREEDGDGIVNELRKTEGVEVALLIHDTAAGAVKVSLRSRALVDVTRIATRFGGGGHARAAACTFEGKTVEQVREVVIPAVEQEIARQADAGVMPGS